MQIMAVCEWCGKETSGEDRWCSLECELFGDETPRKRRHGGGGTKAGGLKAAVVNKNRYGDDFYQRIGAIGGKASGPINPETGKRLKGFAVSGRAREAGRLGGLKSRRKPRNS